MALTKKNLLEVLQPHIDAENAKAAGILYVGPLARPGMGTPLESPVSALHAINPFHAALGMSPFAPFPARNTVTATTPYEEFTQLRATSPPALPGKASPAMPLTQPVLGPPGLSRPALPVATPGQLDSPARSVVGESTAAAYTLPETPTLESARAAAQHLNAHKQAKKYAGNGKAIPIAGEKMGYAQRGTQPPSPAAQPPVAQKPASLTKPGQLTAEDYNDHVAAAQQYEIGKQRIIGDMLKRGLLRPGWENDPNNMILQNSLAQLAYSLQVNITKAKQAREEYQSKIDSTYGLAHRKLDQQAAQFKQTFYQRQALQDQRLGAQASRATGRASGSGRRGGGPKGGPKDGPTADAGKVWNGLGGRDAYIAAVIAHGATSPGDVQSNIKVWNSKTHPIAPLTTVEKNRIQVAWDKKHRTTNPPAPAATATTTAKTDTSSWRSLKHFHYEHTGNYSVPITELGGDTFADVLDLVKTFGVTKPDADIKAYLIGVGVNDGTMIRHAIQAARQ